MSPILKHENMKRILLLALLLSPLTSYSQVVVKCDFESTPWSFTGDWLVSTSTPLKGLHSLKTNTFKAGQTYEITSPNILFQGDGIISFTFKVVSGSQWHYQVKLANVDEGGYNYNGLQVNGTGNTTTNYLHETHGASLAHYKLIVNFWSDNSSNSTLILDDVAFEYTPGVLDIKYKNKSFKFNKIIKAIY